MPDEKVIINVRQGLGTYIAKAKGHTLNASCTAGPAQAAEALAHKLGLAPSLLQKVVGDDLAYGCSRFEHPGHA